MQRHDAEYYQCFQDHFQEVFGAECVPASGIQSEPPREPQAVAVQGPSIDRIIEALLSLPNAKAIGLDGIDAELLKIAACECAFQLHELLQKVWADGYWPMAW